MDYETKYNGALERAKALCNDADTFTIYDITTIFPELEEDMIRKDIISYLRNEKIVKRYISDIEIDKWIAWLEKQGKQKQTWKPNAAQLIVIKDLIEDKNTSKVNKVILRGMFDEFKQFTNTNKREIDDAYLQGICDAKHELEKQGKTLDADNVIEWIKNYASLFAANWAILEDIIEQFKKDFGL